MSKENKELVTSPTNEVTNYNEADWGHSEMSQSDLIIPRIELMQPLSTHVTEGSAKFGDFICTLDNSVISDIERGFQFLPFYMTKFHFVSKLKDRDFKYDRTEPILNAMDEAKPWEDADPDGTPIKRTVVRQFYGFVNDNPVPMIIRAKGTSTQFAKKLITQMYVTNKASRLPPCGVAIVVKGRKEKNAKGQYAVMDFVVKGKATNEQIAECKKWYDTVKTGGAVVQEEETQTNMAF